MLAALSCSLVATHSFCQSAIIKAFSPVKVKPIGVEKVNVVTSVLLSDINLSFSECVLPSVYYEMRTGFSYLITDRAAKCLCLKVQLFQTLPSILSGCNYHVNCTLQSQSGWVDRCSNRQSVEKQFYYVAQYHKFDTCNLQGCFICNDMYMLCV